MKKNKYLKFKEELYVFLFIGLFILLNIFFLQRYFLLGWDESVYLGMGKYLFSLGKVGLFEPLRPVGLPIIFGFIWFFGLKNVLFYRVVEIIFAGGSLYLVYVIGSSLFDRRTGLIGMIILGLTPIFFHNAFQLLTEIPSTFFALLAAYSLVKKRLVFSGIFSGMAFLFKFPQGLFFLGILFILLIWNIYMKNNLKNIFLYLLRYSLSFFIILLIFLAFNYVMYADETSSLFSAVVFPFVKAAEHQSNPLHGVPSFLHNIFYYPLGLLKDNPSLLFLFPGIFFLHKKKSFHSKKFLLIIIPLFFLIYFTSITNKQLRFSLLFLPYLCILSSYGVCRLFSLKKGIVSKCSLIFILIALLFNPFLNIIRYNYPQQFNEEPEIVPQLYKYFENSSKTILTTIPMPAAYTNAKYIPFYFSVDEALPIYEMFLNSSQAVIFNYNFFPCEFYGEECVKKKDYLFGKIKEENKLVFNKVFFEEGYLIFFKK